MNRSVSIYFILFFAFVFSLSGCRKEKLEDNKDAKIEGTWKMIHLTTGMPEIIWKLESDSLHKRITVDVEGWQGSRQREYVLSLENYKYYLTVDSLDQSFIDGKYLILELDDKIMALERVEWEQESNPFLRREFLRIE